MGLLLNDLSMHGQFNDLDSFRLAIKKIMVIKQVANRFGRDLYCNRNLLHAQVTRDKVMQQAVNELKKDEQRSLMRWLTHHGPFWEDIRNHSGDDWFEYDNDVITDTSVGEVAWCCMNGINRWLISLSPSNWVFTPIQVDWVLGDDDRKTVHVENYWEPGDVELVLQEAPIPLDSWSQLEALARSRCNQLTFSNNTFEPLIGHPFVLGAAQRLLFILDKLNCFAMCFDSDGRRTLEGHEIYQDYFTGKKGGGGRGSIFSDSSDTEKEKYGQELTFEHPEDRSKKLFCTWHGKVQTPQLRVHFSWPIRSGEPVYVVYVGPKITKK